MNPKWVQTEFAEPRVLESEVEVIFKPVEHLQTNEVNRTQFLQPVGRSKGAVLPKRTKI